MTRNSPSGFDHNSTTFIVKYSNNIIHLLTFCIACDQVTLEAAMASVQYNPRIKGTALLHLASTKIAWEFVS